MFVLFKSTNKSTNIEEKTCKNKFRQDELLFLRKTEYLKEFGRKQKKT